MRKQWIAAGLLVALLGACGVDGPPTPPAAETTGLTVTGEARFGVTTN